MRKFVKEKLTFGTTLPYILLFCGLFGLLASGILTYEKLETLRHPNYNPSCSINPIISCGSVMDSPFAEILGIPFPLFGLVGFSALITFAFLLVTGVKVKQWIWGVANLMTLGGFLFVNLLIFESVFIIKAICPWCFGVWLAVILLFWTVTVYSLREKVFGAAKGKVLNGVIDFILKYPVEVLFGYYLALLGLLLVRFWYFWETLLP